MVIFVLASCASKSFEWQVSGQFECNKSSMEKPPINRRSCDVDTVTPNERTIHCQALSSGWSRRINKYTFYGSKVFPRPAQPPIVTHCKHFNRAGYFLEGEYYLGANLAVAGDICAKEPELIALPEINKPLPENVDLSRLEKELWSEQRRRIDPLYDFYVPRVEPPYMTGNPIHMSYDGAIKIIKKQCGTLPNTINITGILESDAAWSRKNYSRKVIYKGKLVKKDNKFSIYHDNQALAEEYQLLGLRTLKAKSVRHGNAVRDRLERREKAQKGLALIMGFALAQQGVDVCKSKNSDVLELARSMSLCKE